MSPIAVVLWLWLSVSLAVYGYRIYRRVTQGPGQTRDERGERAARGSGVQGSGVQAPGTDRIGPATALIQNPVSGFDAPPGADDPSDHAPDGPPTEGTAPPASVAPASPPAPLPPSVGASAPSRTPASERRTARVPVADAVQGIRLPCDLAPLLGDLDRIDPFDVAFLTRTFDADHVRDALAAELLRLGFGVAAPSSHRLAATRIDADLVVTVYPDPASVTEGGRDLYPTAGGGSVVARFQS